MKIKVNDIRPKDLMEIKKNAIKADIKYLLKKKYEFEEVACPACNSKKAREWINKEGFNFDECEECNTFYMNPRPNKKLLKEFYLQSKNYNFWDKHIFPKSEKVRKNKIFKPRASEIVKKCRKFSQKKEILLEVGSAYGTFCECIKEENYFKKVIALEPTPKLAQTCTKKGIEAYNCTVEDFEYPSQQIDVVTCFEVIEHLFNPKLFLMKIYDLLKEKGLVILTCPNGQGLYNRVFRKFSTEVNHEHLNYFNPESIKKLAASCGFKLVEITTPGQLDTDLIKNALRDYPAKFKGNESLNIILNKGVNTEKAFQEFLVSENLSTHMWTVLQKNKMEHSSIK
jgi:2-polyprenyl-3-methyl-5-hydroxy-6-metoxy-1,4-benzoquinol methylase